MAGSNIKETYVITGATRGIGLALVDLLSARGDVHVIAGVRDLKHANAKALASKPNVSVVEIDSSRDDAAAEAAKKVEADGVQSVDVVIANAGIAGAAGSVATTSAEALREILNVNSIAPALLFTAFKPLLQRSSKPRFFVTSSLIGSLEKQDGLYNTYEVHDGKPSPQFAGYATSKATVNILTKRIALEEPWLIAVPFHPGVVATDMPKSAFGDETVQSLVDSGAALTPEQSAKNIIKLSETSKQDTHSGRFYDVQKDGFAAY